MKTHHPQSRNTESAPIDSAQPQGVTLLTDDVRKAAVALIQSNRIYGGVGEVRLRRNDRLSCDDLGVIVLDVIDTLANEPLFGVAIVGYRPQMQADVGAFLARVESINNAPEICDAVASDLCNHTNEFRRQAPSQLRALGAEMMKELVSATSECFGLIDFLNDPANWRGAIPKSADVYFIERGLL